MGVVFLDYFPSVNKTPIRKAFTFKQTNQSQVSKEEERHGEDWHLGCWGKNVKDSGLSAVVGFGRKVKVLHL